MVDLYWVGTTATQREVIEICNEDEGEGGGENERDTKEELSVKSTGRGVA